MPTLYDVFYNIITKLFPVEIVSANEEIFIFVSVCFTLSLVFGFIFYIFRTIRRFVGFKG